MKIRKAEMKDLDRIMNVYAYARRKMELTGNPNQWGKNHPPRELILSDIKNGMSYVICDCDKIVGVFMFMDAPDPDYEEIHDGAWLNDEAYGVIHRIAGDGSRRGILKTAVDFAYALRPNIKMDTYKDNLIMQAALKKCGFKSCGTVYVEGGKERIAFQRI